MVASSCWILDLCKLAVDSGLMLIDEIAAFIFVANLL